MVGKAVVVLTGYDEVVQHVQIEGAGCATQLGRQPQISAARLQLSARMIVGQHQGSDTAVLQGGAKDVLGISYRTRRPTPTDKVCPQHLARPVEAQQVKLFVVQIADEGAEVLKALFTVAQHGALSVGGGLTAAAQLQRGDQLHGLYGTNALGTAEVLYFESRKCV